MAGNAVGHLAAAPRAADQRRGRVRRGGDPCCSPGCKIHHDYAHLTACHPAASPACQQLSSCFNSTDWHLGNGIRVALLAAPVLLAMFAGPPVVARELENGTYRYAWTQGIGRVRWTAAKLALLGSVITIAALAVSQLFTWFFAPFLTTTGRDRPHPAVFDTRGLAYAAWTLTAFCLGAFLGTLLRTGHRRDGRHLGRLPRRPRRAAGLPALRYPVRHVLAEAVLRGRLAPDLSAPSSRPRLGWSAATPPSLRAAGLTGAGAVGCGWSRSRRRGVGGQPVAAGAGMARKMAAPALKPVRASAASTTAAEVQLDRSAGKWLSLTYCQPVQ